MKKILLAISALVLSSSLFAVSINDAGYDKLTPEQQAQIVQQVAQMKQQAQDVPVVDQAEKWVNLGANIGKGLAGSAKELGVAVNDFAKTDVGKLTTFLIVYHIVGDDVLHLIGGVLFIILGVWVTTFIMFRQYPKNNIQVVNGKEYRYRNKLPSDETWGYFISYMIIIAIGVLFAFL